MFLILFCLVSDQTFQILSVLACLGSYLKVHNVQVKIQTPPFWRGSWIGSETINALWSCVVHCMDGTG